MLIEQKDARFLPHMWSYRHLIQTVRIQLILKVKLNKTRRPDGRLRERTKTTKNKSIVGPTTSGSGPSNRTKNPTRQGPRVFGELVFNLHGASDGRRRSPAGAPPPERHNTLSQGQRGPKGANVGQRWPTWADPQMQTALQLTRLVLPRQVKPSPT